MDDLQYYKGHNWITCIIHSFKPCYKWMTFNTKMRINIEKIKIIVLNLVINGWPSILNFRS